MEWAEKKAASKKAKAEQAAAKAAKAAQWLQNRQQRQPQGVLGTVEGVGLVVGGVGLAVVSRYNGSWLDSA